MAQFKIGDKLRCIKGTTSDCGAGWELDREFTVESITTAFDENGVIYWSVEESGKGIYGTWVELADKPEIIEEVAVELPKNTIGQNDIIGQDHNIKLIKLGIKEDYPILLIGETGTGKTSLIRQQAIEQKADWVRFNLTGETTVDEFVGKYELEGGQTVWRDGILLQAMKMGKWLIVDEINVALPEILFVLHSLLDDDKFVVVASHSGEVVRPHDNFRFFATMNPVDEYAGTKELNKAFQSRFNMVLQVTYPSKKIESRIVTDKAGISGSTATMMADVAVALRKAKKDDKIFYTCSTRDLIQWGKLIDAGLDEGTAFIVAVLNKANGDKPEMIKIYEDIVKRHLAIEAEVGQPLTVEFFEQEWVKLRNEQNKWIDEKDKRRNQMSAEIIEELAQRKEAKKASKAVDKPAITAKKVTKKQIEADLEGVF
jgi:MoxR-like ATPase